MNLSQLLTVYSQYSCEKVYIKRLASNDNSKNQVYLGGSFDILNILPIAEIQTDITGTRRRESFKSKLNFFWIQEDGKIILAPFTQLILYPDYPEVRLSGFLKGASNAPSLLMTQRQEGRLLFLGVNNNDQILAYVADYDDEISKELDKIKDLPLIGIFRELTVSNGQVELNSKEKLLKELKRIHELGWIDAKRLNSKKQTLPCVSSNCGGYTLEAELGITPNGFSEPDYLGWELKQFSVKDFSRYNSSIVTLMTPEPTGGIYVEEGVQEFIKKYGYADKLGREARINFGGIHKYNVTHSTTSLKLTVMGYSSGRITSTDGYIALIDPKQNIAASWSFKNLLKHWNIKHANACYIPSRNRKDPLQFPFSKQQYCYGDKIILGSMTDFTFFLQQVQNGMIYYDPGIKLELAIAGKRKQLIKRRSQFRIKSGSLKDLYREKEVIDLKRI